jgi:hypothetical protein
VTICAEISIFTLLISINIFKFCRKSNRTHFSKSNFFLNYTKFSGSIIIIIISIFILKICRKVYKLCSILKYWKLQNCYIFRSAEFLTQLAELDFKLWQHWLEKSKFFSFSRFFIQSIYVFFDIPSQF